MQREYQQANINLSHDTVIDPLWASALICKDHITAVVLNSSSIKRTRRFFFFFFWKVESIRSEMEPDGVRSASVPLQNSMLSRDQAETHTTNYKAVSSTAGGRSYAHKRFLSLITPHWLLLYCSKVSSTASENSRGPSTKACTRFFTEVRFTFWKVHRFLWGRCIIFNQCWPWTFVVLEKAKTIQEDHFHG